jgi:hypothetical protein
LGEVRVLHIRHRDPSRSDEQTTAMEQTLGQLMTETLLRQRKASAGCASPMKA